MIRSTIKLLLKNQRLVRYLQNIHSENRLGSSFETEVAETKPFNCRKSSSDAPRLNLLIPGLSIEQVFGGINTALSFFEVLAKDMGNKNLRIILTDQLFFKTEDNQSYKDWDVSSLDDKDGPGLKIVIAGSRHGHTLSVGPQDRFIATAWWTATLVKSIQKWQVETYKLDDALKFVYLIQDFEPGFYKWSARYALAESTYSNNSKTIAVINSKELSEYLILKKYSFYKQYFFVPKMNAKLKELWDKHHSMEKKKKLIVYGRP
mgnify:CR=1 FL=1